MAAPEAAGSPGPSLSVFWLPVGFVSLLAVLSWTPRAAADPALARALQGAALGLGAWLLWLLLRVRSAAAGRSLRTHVRPQHWLQSLVQLSVFAYWGFYWRPVYEMAPLIVAQLAFAYAFDILLSWSRRERYVLGFGPFPIIFSINLFLWFRDEWFWLQLVMIAVGILGKEIIRWERDGASRHVFNPSALSLGLFSLLLIATGTSELTWGTEIAATLTLAPGIYAFLFATGLVAMYSFSITLVAGTAATVLFALSALYFQATGVPYFVDSEIPAAVFLGLHLLVTDPSTSPRSTLGKAIFGALYGLGVFAAYALLAAIGAPSFYDKLLCVPLLNLSVRGLDRLAARVEASAAWSRLRTGWSAPRLNLAHMAVWIALFGTMAATGRTDGRHIGDRVPFWEQACAEGRRRACDKLTGIEATYCRDASAWACNELGLRYAQADGVEEDAELAATYFARACELRFQPACLNLVGAEPLVRAPPRELDLRLLLREGGRNLLDLPPAELRERACEHGWSFACSRTEGTR